MKINKLIKPINEGYVVKSRKKSLSEKYYTCPECHNRTLGEVSENDDLYICDECGAEGRGYETFEGNIAFYDNVDESKNQNDLKQVEEKVKNLVAIYGEVREVEKIIDGYFRDEDENAPEYLLNIYDSYNFGYVPEDKLDVLYDDVSDYVASRVDVLSDTVPAEVLNPFLDAPYTSMSESADEGSNKMTIMPLAGLNSDGFTVVIHNSAGEELFKKEYRYGHTASYDRRFAKWAEDDYNNAKKYGWKTPRALKPYVADIIDGLCKEYGIDKNSIDFVAGKNIFNGGNVTDDFVSRMKQRVYESKPIKEGVGGREKHPEQDKIEQALMAISGTTKVEFDYRPYDGVYKVPENHLIILPFCRDDKLFGDGVEYFKNRKKWKESVLAKLRQLGWAQEDPMEDNDTYLYLVMKKKSDKNESKSINETYWIDNKEVMDEVDRLVRELQADGWMFRDDKYTGSKYYVIFQRRGDNGAEFCAVKYNHEHTPEVVELSYRQIVGDEPMDSFDGMRRRLGKALLPQRESKSIKEGMNWTNGEEEYEISSTLASAPINSIIFIKKSYGGKNKTLKFEKISTDKWNSLDRLNNRTGSYESDKSLKDKYIDGSTWKLEKSVNESKSIKTLGAKGNKLNESSSAYSRVRNYLENHPYDSDTDVEDICAEVADNLFDADYNNMDDTVSYEIYRAVDDYLCELEESKSINEAAPSKLTKKKDTSRDVTNTYTTGDCTWALEDGYLTVSGNGAMEDYDWNNAPWGKAITSVIIEDGVTAIGSYAFYGCDNLTKVTIPNSVVTIGAYAFRECDNLMSVTIGDSVTTIGKYAFSYCKALNMVHISDGVTTIENGAFYGCDSLTSVTIPDSVTTIGDYAFGDEPKSMREHTAIPSSYEFDDDVDDLTYYYDDELFKDNLENSPYTEVASKQVMDSDGFMTDYTMYMDINTGKYVFVFGDKDAYSPEDGYFDWECDTEEEAREWFDSYNGFDDFDDDTFSELSEEASGSNTTNDKTQNSSPAPTNNTNKQTEESPIVAKRPDGSYLIPASNGDGYVAFNRSDVCMGNISAANDDEAKGKFNANKFDEKLQRNSK